MRILLTNDDGIDAPGLDALRAAAEGFGELIACAPLREQSGCGHGITTNRPFTVHERGPSSLAVDGTPADCVRVAFHRLPGAIDWVLSGINAGANLGIDIYHSGTVAAVREAALRGVPAIAVSQYRMGVLATADWRRTAALLRPLLGELLSRPRPPGTFLNVNFPWPLIDGASPSVIWCPVDPSPLPLSYREEEGGLRYSGVYQSRGRVPASDVDVCFGGAIAVSEIHVMERS